MCTQFYGSRLLLTLVFGITIGSIVFGQEQKPKIENEIIAEEYGFKISRPDDGWAFNSSQPKTGSLMLKVSRTDSGGKFEATVVAEPVSESKRSATDERDAAVERSSDKSEISNLIKKSFQVGGREAPGIELDWQLQGEIYRVQQCYVSNQDFLYTIAVHAPADRFESLRETLHDIRDSLRFVQISDNAKRESMLNRLAARCGSEVNWAKSWDLASDQARREHKAVLVLVRSQSGFDIADGMTTIALMDQDIIDFLNEHCVVFRYEKGMKAPIVSYDKYGIGSASFGNTVLLVDPDGTVFGDTFTYEPHTFYDFLQTSFAPRSTTSDPPTGLESKIQIADWFARRGEFSSALSQLQNLESWEAHRLRASIFRRQRNSARALDELGLARDKTNDANIRAELLIDQTILRLSANQLTPKDSLRVFKDLIEEFPRHERLAEMKYWLGICQFASSSKSAAEKTWTDLVATLDENNRWVWRAAAALNSTAFKLDIPPEFGWPTENVIQAFRRIPFEKVDVAQIEQAEKEAIAYLLKYQREDGSWISPPDALKAKGYNTSPFTIAITAICAKSLLAHRQDPEIADRIDRAVNFLIQSGRDAKNEENKPFYMDYSPWANAYLLRFLAQYVNVEPNQKNKISALAGDAIEALVKKQKPGGGWSYYITHNLAQANQPSNQSISFMTAAVTIALLESRIAGFDVPEELTDSALDCLERMRNANKTFTYFLWHETEGIGRTTAEEGAAGRGPLCALALAMAGRNITETEVGDCLDLFLNYRHQYSRERGKSLMHAAPGGQGSHYLMFDYAWAAAAAAWLPDEQKKSLRDRLLELVLSSRSEQGSYLDNPINGWHYGTGMALEAMNLLR